MKLRSILDTDSIAIAYDCVNDWLYVDWKQNHNQESAQRACTLILECLRANPCQKILNDNSNLQNSTAQLTRWGALWLEEMRRAGLRYLAWVCPPNYTMQPHTEDVLNDVARPFVVTFNDIASAYLWLRRQTSKAEQGASGVSGRPLAGPPPYTR